MSATAVGMSHISLYEAQETGSTGTAGGKSGRCEIGKNQAIDAKSMLKRPVLVNV